MMPCCALKVAGVPYAATLAATVAFRLTTITTLGKCAAFFAVPVMFPWAK